MRVAQQRSVPTPARRLQRREGERKLGVGSDTSCGASPLLPGIARAQNCSKIEGGLLRALNSIPYNYYRPAHDASGLCLEQLNPYLRGWRAGGVMMGVAETAVVATTTEVRARGSPSKRSRERAAVTLLDGAHQSSGGRRASTSIRRHQPDGKRS